MPFFEEKIDQNDAAEGIRTAWQKNRLMEDMGEDLADLRYGVGKNLDNERDDVAKVESMLALTGDLDVDETDGPTGWSMFTLDQGIEEFQKKNKLQVDGRIWPERETITALAKATGAAPPPDLEALIVAEAKGEVGKTVDAKGRPLGSGKAAPGQAQAGVPVGGNNQRVPDNDGMQIAQAKPLSPQPDVDAKVMYRKFNFDPSGNGQASQALLNPLDATAALGARSEAYAATKLLKNNGTLPKGAGHNDTEDAFRHAIWNYKMAKIIGSEGAKTFADGHEISRPNAIGERLMDLHNNQVGRHLAMDPKNLSRPDNEVVLEALRQGRLKTSPFGVKNDTGRIDHNDSVY